MAFAQARRIRLLLGWLLAAAMTVSLAAFSALPAQADQGGTPPNIIDYNRVKIADRPALQRFETTAAKKVLTGHQLPESDYDAVRGWARNQVRTQMFADVTAIIKKPPANRTADEQVVYVWFRDLVQQQAIRGAEQSIQEYLKHSGRSLDNYTTEPPLAYNTGDPATATSGYCVYRPPGDYPYVGSSFQECFTPSTNPVGWAVPMPSLSEWVAYGVYQAGMAAYSKGDFNRTSYETAAGLMAGAALVSIGLAVPIALAISAGIALSGTSAGFVVAVLPFAARVITTLVAAAIGGVAAIAASVIIFVVMMVVAGIQLHDQLTMGAQVKQYLADTKDTPPDLRKQLLEDENRSKDMLLPEKERKPKYYQGWFATFIAGTLPEATAEPCSSGLVISGSVYAPGCVNAPAPHPATVDDPVFSITPQGSTTAVQRRWLDHYDPVTTWSSTTRASGKGWFVHTIAGDVRETPSLALFYEGWDGKDYYAERIWDAAHGFRFAVTVVGQSPESNPPAPKVVDELDIVQGDRTKVKARLVVPGDLAINVTVPTDVDLNTNATYVAEAVGAGSDEVGFTWYFPLQNNETPQMDNPPAVASNYYRIHSARVTRYIRAPGPATIYLLIQRPGLQDELRSFTVNVSPNDTRLTDVLTVMRADDVRVGSSGEISLASWSGTRLHVDYLTPQTCITKYVTPIFGDMPDGTNVVTGVSPGTCNARATSEGNGLYLPGSVDFSFSVLPAAPLVVPQTVTFEQPADLPYGSSRELVATADSGAPVTLTVDDASSGICAISGTTVTATALGTCSVTATAAADDQHTAGSLTRTFTVIPASVVVTPADQSVMYGTTPSWLYAVSGAPAPLTGVTCGAEAPLTVGTHPITCSGGSVGPNYALTYAVGTLTVTPAHATVTVSPPSAQYSDALPSLDGIWRADGLLGNDTLEGTLAGCAATDVASSSVVTSAAGTYPLTGCGGLTNPNYDLGYDGSLTVTPEDATVEVAGRDPVVTTGGATADVPLSATLIQAADGAPGDLTKATVDVLLFSSTNQGSTPDYSALGVAVDATGAVAATIPAVATGQYRVVVRVSPGNGYFTGPESASEVVVYQPVAGASVNGSGWVQDTSADRARAYFGISARYDRQKQVQGSMTFSWRDRTDGYLYQVQSTSWSGGGLSFQGSTATASAKARLTVTDPRSGRKIKALSGDGYTMTMVVRDSESHRSQDTFAVSVKNAAGLTIRAVGTASPVPLGGGSIIVRTR